MKKQLAIGLVAAVLSACGGGGGGGSGGTGGSASGGGGTGGSAQGGSGAGGTGGSVDCDQYKGGAAEPVVLKVTNATAASIFLQDECYVGPGVDGVQVDGQSVLDDWYTYSCDERLACEEQGLDCFGQQPREVLPGQTYSGTWSGHLLGSGTEVLPSDCIAACPGDVAFCRPRLVAEPGTHTLLVTYATAQGAAYQTMTVDFQLPTAEVEAVIEVP